MVARSALALSLCAALHASSQDISAIRAPSDWADVPVWNDEWSIERAGEGTQVLSDDLAIRLKHVKPEFLSLFFERQRTIRFRTVEDILRFSRIALPESLDPPMDRQQVPFERRSGPARPHWFNVRLDVFAARVVRPDGGWNELGVLGRIENERVRTQVSDETSWTYVMDIEGIRPGDVVQIHWKYMIPYDPGHLQTSGWRGMYWMDNWARLTSWRVFFHDVLFIRYQHISLEYDLRNGVVLSGAQPLHFNTVGNDVTAEWERAYLRGCMDEVNARPANDLEHIVVQLNVEDRRYWQALRLSGQVVQWPYWNYVLRTREANALWLQRVARKNIPDKQNNLVKEFIRTTTADIAKQDAAAKIERIHEHIATEFDLEKDDAWYADHDNGLQRFGDQVKEENLRTISRYDMYAKIIDHFREPYQTRYLLDKRIGKLSPYFITPLWDQDFLFALRGANGPLLLHPRSFGTRWFANELPFYFANTTALVGDIDHIFRGDIGSPVFADLPGPSGSDNVRNVTVSLEFDPEERSLIGRAIIELNGQFSTLCRGAFLYGEVDSTIMPVYGRRLYDEPQVDLVDQRIEVNEDPPFTTRIELDLDLSRGIAHQGDSSWTIHLDGVLKHMVPPAFNAEGRVLPFYWDMVQQDDLQVEFRVNGPFDIIPIEHGSQYNESASASHTFRTETKEQGHVILHSHLEVRAERSSGDDLAGIAAVLGSAASMTELKILVVPSEERGN